LAAAHRGASVMYRTPTCCWAQCIGLRWRMAGASTSCRCDC
jgi:hypothetical protein